MLSSESTSQHESMARRIAELEARVVDYERGAAGRTELNTQLRILQAAVQSLTDAVAVCNPEGRLVYFNPAAEALFGQLMTNVADPADWPKEYGLFLLDGVTPFPPDGLPLVRALRGEHPKGIEMVVRSEKQPQGAHIECASRPIHDEAGKLCGAVVVCCNIDERRRYQSEREQRLAAEAQRLAAEKEKLQLARMLRVLLDNLDIIVWASDENGVFTFHDGRGADAAGLARGQLVGLKMFDLYPGDSDAADGARRALAGVAAHSHSEAHGVSWEHWQIPVHGEDGAVTGLMGMSLNVTETRKAKAELEAKLALIERQQEVIRNLETPIIQVWDQVLTLPMVGVVDSRRAARVMDDLLAAITRSQARFAILDLTGVDVVDTSTAGHMLGLINAVRLLGAEGIITGIRPNVAQTVVSLGLDLSKVTTLATLRDGLALAMRKLGAQGARTSPLRATR